MEQDLYDRYVQAGTFFKGCKEYGMTLYRRGFDDMDRFIGEFISQHYDEFININEAAEYAWTFVLEETQPLMSMPSPSEMVH